MVEETKKRVGRPRKAVKEPTVIIQTRLKPKDYEIFADKVKNAKISTSAFLRECVLTNKTEFIVMKDVMDNQRKLLYLVNKLSNNMNQIAHRINSDHQKGRLRSEQYEIMLYELIKISQWSNATIGYMKDYVADKVKARKKRK